MKTVLWIILISASVSLFQDICHCETLKIYLANGRTVTGDIALCEDGSIILHDGGLKIVFTKDEVERIEGTSKKALSKVRAHTKAGSIEGVRKGPQTDYDSIISKSAKDKNIDPALMKALMKAESDFQPGIESKKGACGLMQLMPSTAKELGVTDIFDPKENINAGTLYFSLMLKKFNGDINLALAAYNAGPGAVNKHNNEVPPYRETKQYIERVKSFYKEYKKRGRIYYYEDDNGNLTLFNVK